MPKLIKSSLRKLRSYAGPIILILLFPLLTSANGQTRIEKIYNGHEEHIETRQFTRLSANKEFVEIIKHLGDRPDAVIGKSTYSLVNGKMHGVHKTFSTRTTLLEEYTYSNGVAHGPYTRYHPNGNVQYSGTYVNGKKEGEQKAFHYDGRIHYRAFYVNDLYHGEWVSHHDNGKIASKGVYRGGKKEGLWKTYNEKGELESDKRYVSGEEDLTYVSHEKLPPPCPNMKKMRGFCTYIASHEEDDSLGEPYRWRYQRMMIEASCADANNDSEPVIKQKILSMWAKYEQSKGYYCSSTSFDIPKGNILKYAVNAGLDDFIYDMVKWGINLNNVDETDQKTVLDYINDKIERYEGSSLQDRYRSYYKQLKEAGAKHSRELK